MEKSKKLAAFNYGKFAEQIACFYLCIKGYKILERRLRTPMGEIDIIAKKGDTIIAIEVKARKDNHEQEVVSSNQMKRIANAILLFIAKQQKFSSFNLRIDLIIIRPWRFPVHLKDVWQQA